MQTQNIHILVDNVGISNIFMLPNFKIERFSAPVYDNLLANFYFAQSVEFVQELFKVLGWVILGKLQNWNDHIKNVEFEKLGILVRI